MEKNMVVVGGASTVQQCLKAGLVDELQVGGLHFIEQMDGIHIDLHKTRAIETGSRTYLFY